jgi:hypothetical protein
MTAASHQSGAARAPALRESRPATAHRQPAPRAVPGRCILTAGRIIPSRLPRFLAAASAGRSGP